MIRPWKLLSANLVFAAPPWVHVYQETLELPAGRVVDDFYRVVLPDFAAIVAVTDEGQLVMVRGYKHGLRQVVLSVPAGLVDPGEAPLQAAQRELLEETGYTAAEWRDLGRFVVDGNRQCGTMHTFLAHGARWTRARRRDDAEELEVALLTRERAVQAIRDGEIPHLATAAAVALAAMVGPDPV